MKRILGWGDWYIHPFTLLYILVAYVKGTSREYIIALCIVSFHEWFHYIFAKIYHFKIKGVKVLPFGAFLSLEDFGLHHIIEEMVVVLAGPCSHLVLYFIIIALGGDPYALAVNQLVLIFNILPMYPLDGSKFLLLCLSLVMDYQKAIQLQIKISIITLSIIMIMQPYVGNSIIYMYVLYLNYQYIKEYRMYIIRLYTSRKQIYKKHKLHKTYVFYRPYQNIYQINNQFYEEEEMVLELIKRIKNN